MLTQIGSKIKQARLVKGISQKKLGLILGLSDKAISSYEGGRTYPPLETLYQIAKELDKSVDFFINSNKSSDDVYHKLVGIERSLEDINNLLQVLKKEVSK